MNSSSPTLPPATRRYSGRVVLGCDSPGPDFMTIQEIEGKRNGPVWDETTEAEYMERCRQRAEALARDIIIKAMAKAQADANAVRDHARAEVDQAVAEARAKAEAEAQQQLDTEISAHVQSMGRLVAGLQGLGAEVWEARRSDFAALVRIFVRKTLNVEMDAHRAEILEGLLDEACQSMEGARDFTLKVAPQDFELAGALLEQLKTTRPDLGRWRLAADQSLAESGGVVLETPQMLTDNSLASRMALIAPYLDQLSLPEDPAQAVKSDDAQEGDASGDRA